MPYPPQWSRYCQWRKSQTTSESSRLAELNRFAARYRLATNFQGLQLNGYSSISTTDAYSAVMGVFLAYSALEQFHDATKIGKQHLNTRWADLATEPSAELRRAKKILVFLHEQMTSAYLKENLKKFMDGESHNSLYVATALRHAVAHGFMSVHPKGTSPQTSARFCCNLTEMLVKIMDSEFSKWVEALS